LLLVPSLPVLAQDVNTGNSARTAMEEILVTSRRREESLLDTPQAISAITAQQMQVQGVYSIDDAAQFVPNVTLTSAERANNTRIVIRGIGGGFPDPVRVFGSGMYIDGHYIPTSIGGYMSTVDIERIELLRGPQGTLFGKNVTGGAVNIVSVKPGEEFDASIIARLTDDGQQDVRGMINLPITENFFGRLTFASEEYDGYYFNRFLDQDAGFSDSKSGRAAFRWIATDELTLDAALSIATKRDDNLGSQCQGYGENNDAPQWGGMGGNLERRLYAGAEADFVALCAEDMAAGEFVFSSEKETFSDVDTQGLSIGADWIPLDSGSWNSVGVKAKAAYRNMENLYLADRDYLPWPVDGIGSVGPNGGLSNETLSFELLFEGEVNDRFKFTTGFNYFDETALSGNDKCYDDFVASGAETDPTASAICEEGIFFELVPNNPTGLGQWPNGPRINNGGPAPFFQNVSVWNQSIGIFGNATYEINDDWILDFGARYTQDDREFNNIEFPVTGCDLTDNPTGFCDFQGIMSQATVIDEGFFNTAADTFSAFTPMISLTRTVDTGIVYGLISEGFLTGGFNTEINSNIPAVADILPYDPEKVINYELGYKGRILDERVEISSNVFLMNYTDQQRIQSISNPGGIFGSDDPIQIVDNVAESIIYGWEFEMRATPWDGGYMTLDIGYLNNEYEDYSFVDPGDPSQVIDFSNVIINDYTPDWTVNFAADHQFQLDGGATLTPRANIYWQSGLEWAAEENWTTNQPASSCFQDSYFKVDARVSYEPADGDWALAAYSSNLTDERYIDFCDTSRSVWRERLARPQSFGIEFSANFGS